MTSSSSSSSTSSATSALHTLPRFITALDVNNDGAHCSYPFTIQEQLISSFSASIRSKPMWHLKRLDADIVAQWKKDALKETQDLSQGLMHLFPTLLREDEENDDEDEEVRARPPNSNPISPESVEFALGELEYYAQQRHVIRVDLIEGSEATREVALEISAVDTVWQCDHLIDDAIKQRFLAQIKALEDSQAFVDYHPSSDQQVIDLVHPSLYCLVYGRSRIVSDKISLENALGSIGAGEAVSFAEVARANGLSDVLYVAGVDSSNFAISSRQAQEMSCWSTRFMWLPAEVSVVDGKAHFVSYINNLHPVQHAALYSTLDSILTSFLPLVERVLTTMHQRRAGRQRLTRCDYEKAVLNDEHLVGLPPTLPFDMALDRVEPSVRISLANSHLKVITKLAHIVLTPEKPEYAGGSMHVEGMNNERIVATLIYYYDSHNCTTSSLAFRIAVSEPEYAQNDDLGVAYEFGLYSEQALQQSLGRIETCQDRCIVFPNLYQHQVQPFALEDRTRNGHRKILCFFLCDPTLPDAALPSTAVVPPQQEAWLNAEQRQALDLSPLLNSDVASLVGGFEHNKPFITHEEACAFRLELMAERSKHVEISQHVFEREFFLCEH